jgi:hypothetical protein
MTAESLTETMQDAGGLGVIGMTEAQLGRLLASASRKLLGHVP